jgi:hypothetical protein
MVGWTTLVHPWVPYVFLSPVVLRSAWLLDPKQRRPWVKEVVIVGSMSKSSEPGPN